jgi:hypothetical protein
LQPIGIGLAVRNVVVLESANQEIELLTENTETAQEERITFLPAPHKPI